jgi:hypothetical protein
MGAGRDPEIFVEFIAYFLKNSFTYQFWPLRAKRPGPRALANAYEKPRVGKYLSPLDKRYKN